MEQNEIIEISILIRNIFKLIQSDIERPENIIKEIELLYNRLPNKYLKNDCSELSDILAEDIIKLVDYLISKNYENDIHKKFLNKILLFSNNTVIRKNVFEKLILIENRKNNPYLDYSNIDKLINLITDNFYKIGINSAIKEVFTPDVINYLSEIETNKSKQKLFDFIIDHPYNYQINHDSIELIKRFINNDKKMLSKLNELKHSIPFNTFKAINYYDNLYKKVTKRISPESYEIIIGLLFLFILIVFLLYIF